MFLVGRVLVMYCVVASAFVCAYQDFEPVYETGGVAPLIFCKEYPEVLILQTFDQCVQRVLRAPETVYLICAAGELQGDLLAAASADVRSRCVVLHAHKNPEIAVSLARALSVAIPPYPFIGIFSRGRVVLPFTDARGCARQVWETVYGEREGLQECTSFFAAMRDYWAKVYQTLYSWIQAAYDWVNCFSSERSGA